MAIDDSNMDSRMRRVFRVAILIQDSPFALEVTSIPRSSVRIDSQAQQTAFNDIFKPKGYIRLESFQDVKLVLFDRLEALEGAYRQDSVEGVSLLTTEKRLAEYLFDAFDVDNIPSEKSPLGLSSLRSLIENALLSGAVYAYSTHGVQVFLECYGSWLFLKINSGFGKAIDRKSEEFMLALLDFPSRLGKNSSIESTAKKPLIPKAPLRNTKKSKEESSNSFGATRRALPTKNEANSAAASRKRTSTKK